MDAGKIAQDYGRTTVKGKINKEVERSDRKYTQRKGSGGGK